MNNEKVKKPRRKPKAFIKRYGRILIGGTIIGLLLLITLFAPALCKHDPADVDMMRKNLKPCEEYIFGTDVYGRDIFSRVVYGARITLLVSIAVQIFVVAIGAVLGLICGYYRKADAIIMRIMEALSAMPQILLALVMSSLLGYGIGNLMISLVFCALPSPTRMVRAQVLSIKQREFIECEKVMGAPEIKTLFRHVLPHCSSYLLIRFSSGLSSTVLTLSSLAYLGVGINPNIPNWGGIIADGQKMMLLFPHMVIAPGVAIMLTVFGFSMLGDGVRDILDPKLR